MSSTVSDVANPPMVMIAARRPRQPAVTRATSSTAYMIHAAAAIEYCGVNS